MQDESLENTVVVLHARGWAIRELSREFGISRGRIRRILMRNHHKRETGSDLPRTTVKRASKLDPYKDYIAELLDMYTNPPITAQRVLEMIREKGYDGGRSILGDYLSAIRGKKLEEPVVYVETSPGQRGSHDWSEYYIHFTEIDKKEKVIFFSFILNYSRRQYIEVVDDKTQATLFRCLIHTFIYLDGVPGQVKSDNQKVCVDRWEFGKAVFNRKFLEFATHYRFTPLTITPGRPRENLRIERPFYYLEKSFLNARRFLNREDLKIQLQDWLLNVNDRRIHRTTGSSPFDLYQQEYPYLQPLPGRHYDLSESGFRIVNNESCIEWRGYFYAVAAQYMRHTCLVREKEGQVIIYDQSGTEIIQYPLAGINNTGKYVGRRPQPDHQSTSPRLEEVIIRLESMGQVMKQYIELVKKHKEVSFRYHLRKVLSLKVNYHQDDIIMAVNRALKYKVYESGAIENFLIVNAEKKNELGLFPKDSASYEKQTNRSVPGKLPVSGIDQAGWSL